MGGEPLAADGVGDIVGIIAPRRSAARGPGLDARHYADDVRTDDVGRSSRAERRCDRWPR
jgi:hypothetical protein